MASHKAREKSAPSARAPQRRRGRARVDSLLEAGAAVFVEKGYDAATMTEIAQNAGASIGSLYQFFPTKEVLAEALHEGKAAALVQMLDALKAEASGQSAAAMIDRLFQRLTDFLQEHPVFVVLADRRSIDPKRKKLMRARLRGQIVSLFAQAKPPLPPSRAQIMAVLVLHLLRVAVAISGESDLPDRAAVLAELRAMLSGHLAGS
jgi:AcrR family transcriptional regulator